ncbi:hypothetical protein SAMN05660964_02529 [Thiothrix caldifontis]|uniref:Uncharacterized protein n=1 Tax=Thiothrix caldifontis TaxID=525918 RepID=A0A1H4EBX3_9GAMM|nr:hypothetical protein [Thiothrix caldifontis]SEA81802.1 hypothetical protein SAMN05660964_02529 [Thiothrix caldifontis]
MSVRLNNPLLLLVAAGSFTYPATLMAHPPLLQRLEDLSCAANSDKAAQHLETLFNISPPGQHWPDEWLGTQPQQASLHAGTLDIALHTLQQTIERFPKLRETAERVALQWDYCQVLEEQRFYDVQWQHSELKKYPAADKVPLNWRGFRTWGFLTPDPPARFVPLLLDEIRLSPNAYHLFLHRLYRKQCFPHPETGLLASEAEAPRLVDQHRAVVMLETLTEPQAYPFAWHPSCEATPHTDTTTSIKKTPPDIKMPLASPVTPAKTAATALAKKPEKAKKSTKQMLPALPRTTRFPTIVAVNQQAQPSDRPTLKLEQALEPLVIPVIATPEIPIPHLPLRQKVAEGARGDQGKTVAPTRAVASEITLPAIVPITAGGDIPMYMEEYTSETQAHSTTGIVDPQKKKKLRLAGNFADSISLKEGNHTISASATWSPKPNWFVSGNASLKQEKLGYSWSAGYADNKPGGWSAQVNNWGPLKPGDGLALDKAVANIGYKVKSETLKKRNLAAAANVSAPLKGKPSLSGTLQWNPTPKVYARTTANVPLEGDKPNWNYAVGYSNPKPGSWKIEYANYGKNDFPGDNLKDGAITVSRSWQF